MWTDWRPSRAAEKQLRDCQAALRKLTAQLSYKEKQKASQASPLRHPTEVVELVTDSFELTEPNKLLAERETAVHSSDSDSQVPPTPLSLGSPGPLAQTSGPPSDAAESADLSKGVCDVCQTSIVHNSQTRCFFSNGLSAASFLFIPFHRFVFTCSHLAFSMRKSSNNKVSCGHLNTRNPFENRICSYCVF